MACHPYVHRRGHGLGFYRESSTHRRGNACLSRCHTLRLVGAVLLPFGLPLPLDYCLCAARACGCAAQSMGVPQSRQMAVNLVPLPGARLSEPPTSPPFVRRLSELSPTSVLTLDPTGYVCVSGFIPVLLGQQPPGKVR